MASSTASANRTVPSLIRRNPLEQRRERGRWLALFPALLVSGLFHAAFFAMLFFFVSGPAESAPPTERYEDLSKESVVQPAAPPEAPHNEPLTVTDVDPNAVEPDIDINFNNDRLAELSIPGVVNPIEPIGVNGGDKMAPPMSVPQPFGTGGGTGGALKLEGVTGGFEGIGDPGGMQTKGNLKNFNPLDGRSGATREKALREGGGAKEDDAKVALGLNWLVRVQDRVTGAWYLDGGYKDRGSERGATSEIAGTAFGLLPFLGAGKTHRAKEGNPFFKPIGDALKFLISKQDRKTGNFGGSMYAHCLATIAMCEAYGLSQDPMLRIPAQRAVNYLITSQNEGGGWRYTPKEAGDISVTGWAVMALKSGKMSTLDVPDIVLRKSIRFLDTCRNSDHGYSYTPSGGSTPIMTAVALLCRQYLQSWGPSNLEMVHGVQKHLKPTPPTTPSMYYVYYATQVMHHFGGTEWQQWNNKMRANLLVRQDKGDTAGYESLKGSWAPQAGDTWSKHGGRLMETSLCLLTLEVYYRYLPLYYREVGENQQKLLSGG